MSSRLLTTVALAALSFGAAGASLAQGQAPAYRPAMAMFDGRNSVSFPSAPSLDVTRIATLEFWAAPRWQGKLDYDPFLISYAGEEGPRFSVAMGGDKKAIGIVAGDQSDFVTFDFSDGQAHHVAFVFVDDTVDVYIDGAFIDTLAINIADVPAARFVIGSANGSDLAFKGAIADVRIWNIALDQETIATWRLADPLAPGAKHPAADTLVGRSNFAIGRRGFALAEPVVSPEDDALVKAAQQDDNFPPFLTPEGAQ
jgi:hypothetical protein